METLTLCEEDTSYPPASDGKTLRAVNMSFMRCFGWCCEESVSGHDCFVSGSPGPVV